MDQKRVPRLTTGRAPEYHAAGEDKRAGGRALVGDRYMRHLRRMTIAKAQSQTPEELAWSELTAFRLIVLLFAVLTKV